MSEQRALLAGGEVNRMMSKIGDDLVEIGTVRGGPNPRRRVALRRTDGTVIMAKSRGEGWQVTTSPKVIRSFRAEVPTV